MTQYKYISSVDYINKLKFDYVEIYSFQRGTKFQESVKAQQAELDRLRVRIEKRNDLSPLEEERYLDLQNLELNRYITNDKGQFHPSSIKTHTFQATDPQVDRLIKILQTKIAELPTWMCGPIYRDAVVFYDKMNQIVSTLNICLSCGHMETKKLSVNGDITTYDLLTQFFIDLGHEVENE